jgi:hypothetical protein
MQVNNNLFEIKNSINGDNVIAFTNSKQIKLAGYMDSTKVFADLMSEVDRPHAKHLGLIQLMETTHQLQVPFMKDLFAKSQVLTVEEGQTITYDLPVSREGYKCQTAEDTSNLHDYPGLDDTYFTVILNEEFTSGDLLTYDAMFGEQVFVSSEHEVEPAGENFRHYVKILTNDKKKSFPKEFLKPGIQYFKVGNVLGEFAERFSGINGYNHPTGTITNEFLLGDPRGVETFYTRKAANMKVAGLNAFSDEMYSNVMKQIEALGGSDMFVVGKRVAGSNKLADARVGSLLEYFALMELAKMEAYSLMFAKGATIQDANGVRRVNEGVWHQMRRGKLIKYSRPGGITVDHLQEAASYIFKNSNVPIHQRHIKFKGGFFAYQNVVQIIRKEALTQLGSLPAGMLGNDAQIPGTVFSGTLDNLKMNMIQITEAPIPGLGYVAIEHDPSMDYQPFSDRNSSGAYGSGMFAHTSHSLVIEDATSPASANVDTRVKGASLVAGGTKNANIYYVKPEGPSVTWGYEQGRMANNEGFENVASSIKQMGRGFWAYNQSGALVLDVTRYVTIELERLGK